MAHQTIDKRVDDFFAASSAVPPELLSSLYKDLYESYCLSEKALQRFFVLFFATWAVLYAVAEGLVSEANVSSVKVSDLKYLTLVSPVVLAYLAYNLSAANFLATVQHRAFIQCFKHILPSAYDQDLEQILGPPTFLRAERLVLRGESRLQSVVGDVTQMLIVILLVFGTLAAIGHMSWLAWNISTTPWWIRALCVAVAGAIWLRSAFFYARNSMHVPE